MRHLNIITLAAAAVLALASCQEKYITYSGPSYIAFPDTLSICPVQQNGVPFDLVVASTNTCILYTSDAADDLTSVFINCFRSDDKNKADLKIKRMI